MAQEPVVKRTIAFVDGQNLFHMARKAFGYTYPKYDVALIFSQDQDLTELADLVRTVARYQDRWIKIASAYPDSPASRFRRGIDRTDWCPIDRATYDACIDRRDYRP